MLRPALLAMLAALALLPSVTAQGPLGEPYTVRLEDVPAYPIKAELENPMFEVVVDVSCDFVLAHVDPTAPQDPVPIVDAVFQFQSDVVVTGPPTIDADPADCVSPATEATARQPYQISILRTAPGLQAIPGVLKVSPVTPSAGSPGSPEQQIPFTVTADYYSVNQVSVASKLERCKEECVFELEVTNLGNARTQYTFEIVDGPKGGKWNAELPEALLLDSPNSGQGNSTGVARFVVHPGVGDREGSYHLLIHPASADDPSKTGNPLTVKVLAQHTRALGIDAPAGPLVLLLLAGVAIVARRRA